MNQAENDYDFISSDRATQVPSMENIEISERDRSMNYDYASPYTVIPFHTDSACLLNKPCRPKYDRLYWHPSNEEDELMEEMRKLKLRLFEESELE